MRQVRWMLQAASPGTDVWFELSDRVYSGWFHSSGDDEVGEPILAAYDKAVKDLSWLDVRLVQENRSFNSVVLKEVRREKSEDVISESG